MACSCFDTMLSKINEAATEQLKDTPMVEGSLSVEWRNRVFFLDGKENAPVALYVDTEYQPLTKDGSPAKNKKKLQNGIKMSHCPFCGTKFEADDA